MYFDGKLLSCRIEDASTPIFRLFLWLLGRGLSKEIGLRGHIHIHIHARVIIIVIVIVIV